MVKAVSGAKGLRLLALDENEISESGVEHLKVCRACANLSWCPPRTSGSAAPASSGWVSLPQNLSCVNTYLAASGLTLTLGPVSCGTR